MDDVGRFFRPPSVPRRANLPEPKNERVDLVDEVLARGDEGLLEREWLRGI